MYYCVHLPKYRPSLKSFVLSVECVTHKCYLSTKEAGKWAGNDVNECRKLLKTLMSDSKSSVHAA